MNVPRQKLKFSEEREDPHKTTFISRWVMGVSVLLFAIHQGLQLEGYSLDVVSHYLDPFLFVPVFTAIQYTVFRIIGMQPPYPLFSWGILATEAGVAAFLFEGVLPVYNPLIIRDAWDIPFYFMGSLVLGLAANGVRRGYRPFRRT